MVKLLVSKINVMIKPFKMEGEKVNDVPQSVLPTRRYPYTNSIAPNVMASDMMNNHTVSFLGDTAYTGSSIRAPWPVSLSAATDSLTFASPSHFV